MRKDLVKNKYYNTAALRTALIYIVVSAVWILFSDKLLLNNPNTAVYISTVKGWIYTLVVGLFLYLAITREFNRRNKSELRYRRLFETAKDGILLINFDNGMITDVNPFLINLLDYSKSDFLEKHLWEIGIFKDVVASKENFVTLQEKKYVRFEDLPLETKSGRKIQVEFVANAYAVGDEMVIQCNIRDITIRKKMEEKNKWLASFPLLNPWPVIEIDKSLGVVFINDAAKKTFPDLEDKKMEHPFLNGIEEYFANLDIKHKNHTNREVKVNDKYYSQALALVNQQQLRIYAIDITDLKDAERTIIAEKENYQALFSNMINGFAYHRIITDKDNKPIDYKFLEVNSAFEEITGLTGQKVIGRNITEIIPSIKEEEANWIERYGKIALSGQGSSFEDYSPALNKWFNVSAYSPKLGYFATVIEDITDRKMNEKRLQELDKLKDNFLSVTTHELKTPLIPIKSQTQLLLAGDYGPINIKQKHALEMIERNEENLNRLTSDLMDISKIKSNKLNIILEKTSLSDIITNTIKDSEKMAKEKNISISLSTNMAMPVVIVDRIRITQVFNNLIGNALKFTPEGGQIKINVEKNNTDVVITIKDTGIGLDSENLAKLFTPFFQVQNDLNRKYRGTGLGLAVSKGIIEAHGGKMWAESAGEAQGSSFIFTLPIN